MFIGLKSKLPKQIFYFYTSSNGKKGTLVVYEWNLNNILGIIRMEIKSCFLELLCRGKKESLIHFGLLFGLKF